MFPLIGVLTIINNLENRIGTFCDGSNTNMSTMMINDIKAQIHPNPEDLTPQPPAFLSIIRATA
jgi:hypothetical protein